MLAVHHIGEKTESHHKKYFIKCAFEIWSIQKSNLRAFFYFAWLLQLKRVKLLIEPKCSFWKDIAIHFPFEDFFKKALFRSSILPLIAFNFCIPNKSWLNFPHFTLIKPLIDSVNVAIRSENKILTVVILSVARKKHKYYFHAKATNSLSLCFEWDSSHFSFFNVLAFSKFSKTF